MSGKRVIFNTQERNVSGDKNLLQQFQTYERSEIVRALYGVDATNGVLNPGYAPLVTGTFSGGPLPGDVFGGLLVRPDNAGYLTIDAGTVGLYMPTLVVDSNDSPYVVVNDPGVTSTSQLLFTPNTSGSIRWDVVECQAQDVLLKAQENRDIYNLTTRTFAPSLVNKQRGNPLVYRIRQGTPGSGMPANDADWLPLACIYVPSGASGFNACDVYDVRPLVSERSSTMPSPRGFTANRTASRCLDMGWYLTGGSGGEALRGYSLFEGGPGGYLAGGTLNRSTPGGTFADTNGGDAAYIDFSIADNRASGTSLVSQHWYCIAALFPNGLPRWVRYNQGNGSRLPSGTRGIVCLVDGLSSHPGVNGIANSVAAPDICGLSGTHPAVALGHLMTDPTPHLLAASGAGRKLSVGFNATTLAPRVPSVTPSGIGTGTATFMLTPGTDFPANARIVRVRFVCLISVIVGAGIVNIWASISSGAPIYWSDRRPLIIDNVDTALGLSYDFDVPVIHTGNQTEATDSSLTVVVDFPAPVLAIAGISTASANIVGVEY